MKARLLALAANLRQIFGLDDIFTFAGIGCVCYGIGQVSGPIAWMVGGAALFWLGVRKP